MRFLESVRVNKNNCLIKGCDEQPLSRQLCSAHYQQAAYAVQQKKTTWRKLEKEGRAGPSRRRNHGDNVFLAQTTKPT